jgi:hypothetical protein
VGAVLVPGLLALALAVLALRAFPAVLPAVIAVAFVAAGDLVTHWIFDYACGPLWESPSYEHVGMCDAYPGGLPLIGIPVVIAGGVAAWVARRRWPLAAGLALAAVAGLFPWIAYGDPAGNWNGLFV